MTKKSKESSMTDAQLDRICKTIEEGLQLVAATLVSHDGVPVGESGAQLVENAEQALAVLIDHVEEEDDVETADDVASAEVKAPA